MTDSALTCGFLNTVLMLTHPAQYIQCAAARRWTMVHKELVEREPRISKWPLVFTGCSVMINRVTPKHCDSSGNIAGYDQLVSLGNAVGAILELPDFGLTFSYGPGTIMMVAGKRVAHAVGEWQSGDRICYANWMRDSIVGDMSADTNVPSQTPWATVTHTCQVLESLAKM
jgi:hypothetical protein